MGQGLLHALFCRHIPVGAHHQRFRAVRAHHGFCPHADMPDFATRPQSPKFRVQIFLTRDNALEGRVDIGVIVRMHLVTPDLQGPIARRPGLHAVELVHAFIPEQHVTLRAVLPDTHPAHFQGHLQPVAALLQRLLRQFGGMNILHLGNQVADLPLDTHRRYRQTHPEVVATAGNKTLLQ